MSVPATTNNITKGIINFLLSQGHFAFRVNTTGVWDERKRAFRKANTTPGTPDILACVNGKFVAIEVKNKETGDRVSAAQRAWHAHCVASQGTYVVALGYNHFIGWWMTSRLTNFPAC